VPPPFFASTVASPTPHPYLWGSQVNISFFGSCRGIHSLQDIRFLFSFLLAIFQHLLIPPYGTPVPYPDLYPPWGVYAHPNMITVILVTYIFLTLFFFFHNTNACAHTCDTSTPLLLLNTEKFMNLSAKFVHYIFCRLQTQYRSMQSWKERVLVERTERLLKNPMGLLEVHVRLKRVRKQL
jgi:hypothetical protein